MVEDETLPSKYSDGGESVPQGQLKGEPDGYTDHMTMDERFFRDFSP